MNEARLGIYLNDHLAGATAGLALARRVRAENAGSPLGGQLQALVGEMDEDRAALEGVMAALGVERSALKLVLAWLGEKLGRLKLNGQFFGYSGLSRLEELEGLCLESEMRLSLWRTLRRLARGDERLGRFDFAALIGRVEQQRRILEKHRLQSMDEAFQEPRGAVVPLTPGASPGARKG